MSSSDINQSASDITLALTIVTEENPARGGDELDWERCAFLHNYILERGWVGSGRDIADIDKRTWWEYHGEKAEALRPRLSPSLVKFFEHAWQGPDHDHSFFYYVNGLMPPGGLWMYNEVEQGVTAGESLLTLYSANDIASHPVGLKFDQEGHDCIMKMAITDTVINGRMRWWPLETVLSFWILMAAQDKVQAVGADVNAESKFPPWIIIPYSEEQLRRTLEIFSDLVEFIEDRIPDLQGEPAVSLVDHATLDAASIPPGFARDFLTKARRPRFRYIAPGLLAPSSENPPQVPFTPSQQGLENRVNPILLFPGDKNITSEMFSKSPFLWPYDHVKEYQAGLYLDPSVRSSNHAWEDSCHLLLPFEIGRHGFARTSDGDSLGSDNGDKTTVSPDIKPKDTNSELYQPGHRPFTEAYGVQLVSIFESWKHMVEEGDWEVNADGVVGGIEKFKDADTEEHWWKFQIPLTW